LRFCVASNAIFDYFKKVENVKFVFSYLKNNLYNQGKVAFLYVLHFLMRKKCCVKIFS
jgi:hypothetical protein